MTQVSQDDEEVCDGQDGAPTSAGMSGIADLTGELFVLLQRVIRGMRRKPEPDVGADVPLTKRHGSALYCLLAGPQTVGELAGHLDLELATVSGVVAELDRAGIVERRQDPADRRRTIVTITQERRPRIESWMQGAVDPLVQVVKRLDLDERRAFLKAMTMLDEELTGS